MRVQENINIHIGQLIRHELDRQGRKMTWFAAQIHCDVSNAYKILKRKNIDVELLVRISQVLDHNFLVEVGHIMLQKRS